MRFKRIGQFFAGLGACAVVATGVAGVANATPSSPERNVEVQASVYSDEDVVGLFFNGSGPLADANPEIVKALGFGEGNVGLTDDEVRELAADLNAEIPDFNAEITQKITSGDPFLVEEGVVVLEDGIKGIAQQAGDDGGATGQCVLNPIVAVDTLAVHVQLAVVELDAFWTQSDTWTETVTDTDHGRTSLAALIAEAV